MRTLKGNTTEEGKVARYTGTAYDLMVKIYDRLDEILNLGTIVEHSTDFLFFEFHAADGQSEFSGLDYNGRLMKIPGLPLVYVDGERQDPAALTVSEDKTMLSFPQPLPEHARVHIAGFGYNADGTMYFDPLFSNENIRLLLDELYRIHSELTGLRDGMLGLSSSLSEDMGTLQQDVTDIHGRVLDIYGFVQNAQINAGFEAGSAGVKGMPAGWTGQQADRTAFLAHAGYSANVDPQTTTGSLLSFGSEDGAAGAWWKLGKFFKCGPNESVVVRLAAYLSAADTVNPGTLDPAYTGPSDIRLEVLSYDDSGTLLATETGPSLAFQIWRDTGEAPQTGTWFNATLDRMALDPAAAFCEVRVEALGGVLLDDVLSLSWTGQQFTEIDPGAFDTVINVQAGFSYQQAAATSATSAGSFAAAADQSRVLAATASSAAQTAETNAVAARDTATESAASAQYNREVSAVANREASQYARRNYIGKPLFEDGLLGGWSGDRVSAAPNGHPLGRSQALEQSSLEVAYSPLGSWFEEDLSGRSFRLTGWVLNASTTVAEIGLLAELPDGVTETRQVAGVGGAMASAWEWFDVELELPEDATARWKPLLRMAGAGVCHWTDLQMRDISDEVTVRGYAAAAVQYEAQALAHVTAAGEWAYAAEQSKVQAETSAAAASTHETNAATASSNAESAAAEAVSSKNLTASLVRYSRSQVFDFIGGGENWSAGDAGLLDYTPLPDSRIKDVPGIGKVAEQTGFEFCNTGRPLALIDGHTYELEARVRVIQDSTLTGGTREKLTLRLVRLDESGGLAASPYGMPEAEDGFTLDQDPLRSADGWVTFRGRYIHSDAYGGSYVRGRLYNCYDSSGTHGDAIWQVAHFRFEDATERAALQGSLQNVQATLTQDYVTRVSMERDLAPIGGGILRSPASLWTGDIWADVTVLQRPAVAEGSFVEDDPDFGEAYEAPAGLNRTIGPAYPSEFSPGRVYKITARFKVIDDGADGQGCRVFLGAATQIGTTRDLTNIQDNDRNGTTYYKAADGVQERVTYASTDLALLAAYGITDAAYRIDLSAASPDANKCFFYLRQNVSTITAGQLRVASLVIQDVTETLSATSNLRTELKAFVNEGVQADLTTNYLTETSTREAISAAELLLSARIAPGGLNDGMDDPDYWVNGWSYSEADRTAAPSLEEAWADVTHVSDAAEGKVLRFDRNYRVTSERYMRPVVPGQVWRVKLRMRYEVMPTLDRITLWAVGVKSDGSYAGYSTVKDFWNGSTSWQDFEAEFIPADLHIAAANGAVKWCLMLTVMSQGGTATADGVALLSSIQLREASDVKLVEANLEENYRSWADTEQALSERDAVLTASIKNAAASSLPSGFDGDGQYWTSTISGAPGEHPLDSAWMFSTGAKEGRAAGMALDGHSGQQSKIFTRGLATPANGRKYRVTVRCAFFGTVTSGTASLHVGVKHLGADYAYLNNQDFNVHTVPADSAWHEYTFEVEAGDTNTAPYWRIGFTLRTDLFTGTGNVFFSKVLFEDISNVSSLSAQITDLDQAITGPDGAIALSEKTLRAEAQNVAAAGLPYDFADDATYWTSTVTGAPGDSPLDSRWSFANGANEGRKAVLAPADYTGSTVWLMTRGVLTPVRGRRYRLTVRCRLQGTVSGTRNMSMFFRPLDGDYVYDMGIGSIAHTDYLATNTWTDFTAEVVCSSSNVSPFWRAGFYVRGADFTGDGDFEVSKIIVQDITEAHALNATVTLQGEAITDLEDNASAGYLIRAQAGNEVSLLQLIAADGSEGSASVAKLQAQDIILEGSVGANMLTVGTGKNLLENSDFRHGETSLVFYEYGAVSNGGSGEIRDDDSLFSTPFYPTARLISLASGTTGSGWVGVDFRPTNPNETLGIGYAVIPGDFYEFHAAMNLRRVKASVRLYWYKEDGTACLDGNSDPIISYLETASEPNLTGNGLSIGEWPRFGGIGQAPEDAAYVVPSIRLIEVVATGPNQDVHIVWPMFCRTETADAPLSPYAPGGVTMIHGNRILTGSIDAEFSITAATITADLFAAETITTDIMTVTGYLDMDAVNTGMRIGKQSVVDSSDGAYFGRTEIDGNTGFGFYIGRTTGGVEQHIRMTEQGGLEIKNAEFMLGSSTASRTTYTGDATYTIPAGTQRISFAGVGGGGEGGGGQQDETSGVQNNGQDGQPTLLTLKDGAEVIGTWTAAGGSGGKGAHNTGGYTGSYTTSPYSPYGNGGAGKRGGSGNSDTGRGISGHSGEAGHVQSVTELDISSLANPILVIDIGAGGSGASNGASGTAGFAEVTVYGAGNFPAGPVARQQAASGTVFCTAGADTLFPAFGSPGFWQVWGGSIGVYAEIDDDGGTTLISKNGTNSFFSARNRPKVLAPGSSVNLTYRFWPMG